MQQRHTHILGFFERKEMLTGISLLKEWAKEESAVALLVEVEEVETLYQSMLRFFGVADDAKRDGIYHRICSSCYRIADEMMFHHAEANSNNYFYQQQRNYKRGNRLYPAIAIQKLKESALKMELSDNAVKVSIREAYEVSLNELFITIWLLPANDRDSLGSIAKIDEENLPTEAHYLIISSLLLGMLNQFSPEKTALLLRYCMIKEEKLSRIAFVSLLIVLKLYEQRIVLYERLNSGIAQTISYFNDQTGITNILLQLLQTGETEKVTQHLQKEVMPEIFRISNEAFSKFGDITTPGEESSSKNPEWKNFLKDVKVSKLMDKLGQMQKEGVDIHLMTFSSLKNTSFFNTISNWFLPFTRTHTSISSLADGAYQEGRSFLDIVEHSSFLCDSDKYSLCQTVVGMPEQTRSVLMHRIAEDTAEFEKSEKDLLEMGDRKEGEAYSNNYIKDLYRFLKLFRYKDSFLQIFDNEFGIYLNPSVKLLLSTDDKLRISEFLMDKEHYSQAIIMFKEAEETSGENQSEICQKIGFCYQKLGLYDNAIEYYKRSDIIDPDKLWTISKIAFCYKQSGQLQLAIRFYSQALKISPESLDLNLMLGQLYAECNRYEEALVHFRKIEFLGKKPQSAWRALAWTLLLLGRPEEAESYYGNILSQAPTADDYLNAGHCYWCSADIANAITCYSEAVSMFSKGEKEWRKTFLADADVLTRYGITSNDMSLILDKIEKDQTHS